MTSSLVESSSSSSFVILSRPPSVAASSSPAAAVAPCSLEAGAASAATVPPPIHNPKSLIEITAKRAVASLQDLKHLHAAALPLEQRNCLSLNDAAASIGPVLALAPGRTSGQQSPADSCSMNSSTSSSSSSSSVNEEEAVRSNGTSLDVLVPSAERKTSNVSTSSSVFSGTSSGSKMSEAEIYSVEQVLVELRLENEKLREVVDKNNAAMRRQLTIVQNWQKEVKSSRIAFQDLRRETDQEIAQLKQTNADLRDTIERTISQHQQQQQQQQQQLSSSPQQLIGSEDNNSTKTGDSLKAPAAYPALLATHSPTTATYAAAATSASPVYGAESSNYWWDMSMELADLRTRLDKINVLEQTVSSKEGEVAAHQAEIAAAKQVINHMEQEIEHLRTEVINGSADSGMIASLQSQVRIFMQSYADEQRRSSDLSDHVTKLLDELSSVRQEKLDMELKLNEANIPIGTVANPDTSCDSSLNLDEPVIDSGRKQHHHRSHHRHHEHRHRHREPKVHKERPEKAPHVKRIDGAKEGVQEAGDSLTDNHTGRYLKKLIRGANVANLTSGLKLKSFKDLGL